MADLQVPKLQELKLSIYLRIDLQNLTSLLRNSRGSLRVVVISDAESLGTLSQWRDFAQQMRFLECNLLEAFRIYYVKRREGDFSDLIPFTKGETDDDPIDELFSSMPSWGMWNMESRRAGLLSLEYALDGFDE